MAKNSNSKKIRSTVNNAEIEKFQAMADEWWDEGGKFKPLHQLNPVRIKFIRDIIAANGISIKKIKLLDIGCGGGLLSEPMARLGANVTGIDAGEKNIKIAELHARNEGLDIDYRCITAEELVSGAGYREPDKKSRKSGTQNPKPSFDVVTAMEIIEHVADVPAFVEACSALVKPGGLLFFSTLNRTVKSFAMAIVGAEYILRWLPRGTHDWNKFLRPSEVVLEAERHKMEVISVRGVTYNPLNSQWALSDDTDVNYMVALQKRK